ncbi:MAG: DivIVA-like cell division protein Wag31 [Pseudonocardiaceae bacterium]
MPLTPIDVSNVAFGKPPRGKRGYNEDEVDSFLELVEAELTQLLKEKTALRKQLDLHQRVISADAEDSPRLAEPSQPVKTPTPPPMTEQASPSSKHHVRAARMLSLAQETADRLTGDAKSAAEGMLSEARAKSEQLRSDAQAAAGSMINQARVQAKALLNDAQARVKTLDRQSQEKIALLEREAANKHAEIIGSISQEKAALEQKVNELRIFESEYRTRLVTYLDSRLRELDKGDSAAPESAIHTEQDFAASRSSPTL